MAAVCAASGNQPLIVCNDPLLRLAKFREKLENYAMLGMFKVG